MLQISFVFRTPNSRNCPSLLRYSKMDFIRYKSHKCLWNSRHNRYKVSKYTNSCITLGHATTCGGGQGTLTCSTAISRVWQGWFSLWHRYKSVTIIKNLTFTYKRGIIKKDYDFIRKNYDIFLQSSSFNPLLSRAD